MEHWQTYWAVLKPTLGQIARVMSGKAETETRAALEQRLSATTQPESQGSVAVIPLRGLITPRPSLLSVLFGGGGGLQGFRSDLRAAIASDDIEAVLIDIDSPGGSTDLLTETAAEIRAATRKKPVVAVANTMAASAAYWLASQATELVVTPSGEVGSIGVFAVHEDWSAFNEKFGVEPTYVSYGTYKTELNPDAPLSDEGREELQALVDDHGNTFVSDVARGRGTTAAKVKADFGQGRMLRAKQAVEVGMADRVESFERTLARLTAGEKPQRASAAAPALLEDETELQRPQAVEENPADDDKQGPNGKPEEDRGEDRRPLSLDRPRHL